MNGRLALLACAAIMLAGCASSEYGAIDEQKGKLFGYKETRQADGSYLLLVNYPAVANGKEVVNAMWDRRARELCGDKPITKNIFNATRPTVRYDYYGGRPGGYVLEGYLTCGDAKPEKGSAG
jgi:hypothetical protein